MKRMDECHMHNFDLLMSIGKLNDKTLEQQASAVTSRLADINAILKRTEREVKAIVGREQKAKVTLDQTLISPRLTPVFRSLNNHLHTGIDYTAGTEVCVERMPDPEPATAHPMDHYFQYSANELMHRLATMPPTAGADAFREVREALDMIHERDRMAVQCIDQPPPSTYGEFVQRRDAMRERRERNELLARTIQQAREMMDQATMPRAHRTLRDLNAVWIEEYNNTEQSDDSED